MKNQYRGTHGGLDYSRLKDQGINPDDIIDFSVSINPYPVHPNVLEAVRQCSLTRYPDTNARELRERIATHENCSAEEILAVSGTSQGIHLIGEAFLEKDSRVLIASPAYSQYEKISRLKKAEIREVISRPDDNFNPPIEKIIDEITNYKPHIFWICNPNNPTGTYVNRDDMRRIEEAALKTETIVVIDEAYVAFTEESLRYRDQSANILRLNSMTKDYGIPGLRIGYIHGNPSLLAKIASFQPEWSISEPAQKAGIACLDEGEYYRNTWKEVRLETERFRRCLMKEGLSVYETESNFFMVKLGNRESVPEEAKGYAALLEEKLESRNMQIRDCASFGLPDHVRIGIHSRENNEKLCQAIKEESSLWR